MLSDYGYSEDDKLGKPYDIKLLRRLIPFIIPHWRLLLAAILLIVLITLFELAIPFVTKIAIDRYIVPKVDTHVSKSDDEKSRYLMIEIENSKQQMIIDTYPDLFIRKGTMGWISYENLSKLTPDELTCLRQRNISGLKMITVLFVILILMDFVANYSQVMMMEFIGQKIMHELRMSLFTHVQSLAISFFSKNPVGRLVTRVTNDIQNMYELFTSVTVFVFKDMFLLLGIMVVLLVLNWKLALVSFAVLPFVVISSIYFSNQARDAFRQLRLKIAEINTHFSETIGGIKVIQIFLQEYHNYQRFKKINHEYYLFGMKQIHVVAIFLPIVEFCGHTAIAAVILYGGNSVINDTITLGSLVAFISYMKMFFRPIRDLAEKYNIMQNAMASAERIFLLLDKQEKLPEPPKNQPISDMTFIRDIKFENVSFSYGSEHVLKNISFCVYAGETIALVGPTGSGKTSLIHLMIRFYDPISGKILINGRDIKSVPLTLLRSKMALVSQDPFLFSGTVRSNIFQNAKLSSEEMNHILRSSNCDYLIDKLPKGLDTELSEGGSSISSGERQLISIARAFAKNPDLIILDEATSYIDSETEVKIQKALENLMANRTSIIVAHRLSTARKANTIYVLNRGRIIESGNHETLMRLRGFYYRLNQIQG